MIITPTTISNDPITSLKRKACFIALEDSDNTLSVHYIVKFYDESDAEINNARVRPYSITLRANNSTFVDPTTGNYVDAETEGAMGEYDFIVMAIESGANIKDMIVSGALRADGLTRFDV